jgi:hypothetical protein
MQPTRRSTRLWISLPKRVHTVLRGGHRILEWPPGRTAVNVGESNGRDPLVHEAQAGVREPAGHASGARSSQSRSARTLAGAPIVR